LPCHSTKCTLGVFAAQPHPHAAGPILVTHTQKTDATQHAHPVGHSLSDVDISRDEATFKAGFNGRR
jgi:hypothetical protein